MTFIFFSFSLFLPLTLSHLRFGKEIDVKRGERVQTLTPTPRRRSDPEFLKWDSEINAMLDDDYEGKNRTILYLLNILYFF